jgi:glucose-6-phosphate isomerase
MESNGKSVRRSGAPVTRGTCPVAWGEPGNNAQHSFFQLLHQGDAPSALDVLVPARSSAGLPRECGLTPWPMPWPRWKLSLGGYTQAEAAAELQARGRSAADVAALAPHKVHAGGRPTTVLAFQQLDAPTLGKLVALYEHKVHVQSVLWDLNPSTSGAWELGKKMAEGLAPAVGGEAPAHLPVLAWLNARRWVAPCRSELARDRGVGSKLPPTRGAACKAPAGASSLADRAPTLRSPSR